MHFSRTLIGRLAWSRPSYARFLEQLCCTQQERRHVLTANKGAVSVDLLVRRKPHLVLVDSTVVIDKFREECIMDLPLDDLMHPMRWQATYCVLARDKKEPLRIVYESIPEDVLVTADTALLD